MVDEEAIPYVSTYKYLGCVVHEHLELIIKEMIKDKATTERYFGLGFITDTRKSETCIGVPVGIHSRLLRQSMTSFADSNMTYKAEIWECKRSLEAIAQVQLRACLLTMCIFGVGTLHKEFPYIIWLPVMWEARVRCV